MRRKHYFAIALMCKINCGKLSWYKQNFFENFKYFKRIVSTLSSIGNRDGRTVKFESNTESTKNKSDRHPDLQNF